MSASDGPSGLELLRRSTPDLVLVDLKMPGMDGISYLESVKALDPDIAVVMITGYATLELAVEAMKAGAYDFLPKPFKPAQLREVARRGIEHRTAALRFSALLGGESPAGVSPSTELQLAMLAHRFKAPLAAMRQCVWVVLQGYAGEVSPQVKSMIELVAERADQMIRFVNDWLTLSRLELDKGIREPRLVDIAELVNGVVERARPEAGARKIAIQFLAAGSPGSICADPASLDELVGNLVDNAVRYTPEDGAVTVRVDAVQGGVTVKVSDTGPGISREDLGHIFEPFYRGQAQKGIPGTGLGLPIVKRIAEGHGGRVEVRTTLGEGSEFQVFLPQGGPS
jgi:signal transduction histidine kinase